MFKAVIVSCCLYRFGFQLPVCFVLRLVGMLLSWFGKIVYLSLPKSLILFLQYIDVCTWYRWCATLSSLFTPSFWCSYGALYPVVVLFLSCYVSFILKLVFRDLILVCNNWLLHFNLRVCLVGYTYVTGILFSYCSEGFLVSYSCYIYAYLCIYLTDRKVTG
jgi:hypothetical protein